MKDVKECFGCKGHFNPFANETAMFCELPPKIISGSDIYECPCVTCLVKVICNTSCLPVRKYNTAVEHISDLRMKEYWTKKGY